MWLVIFVCFLASTCIGINFNGAYSLPPYHLILQCEVEEPLPYLKGYLLQSDHKASDRLDMVGIALGGCESLSPLKGLLALPNSSLSADLERIEETWKLYLDDSTLFVTPVKTKNRKEVQLEDTKKFRPLSDEEYETFIIKTYVELLVESARNMPVDSAQPEKIPDEDQIDQRVSFKKDDIETWLN